MQKAFRYIVSPAQLFVYIIREKPAVIHINTSLDAKAFWRDFIYLLVAKLLRTKVLYQVHGGALKIFTGKHVFFKAFLKAVFRLPDAVVLLSSYEMNNYRAFTNFKHLVMIPNAIDLSGFSESPQHKNNLSNFTLVYVGRLAENKGIFDTIEAINILVKDGKAANFQFLIAGSGPAEQVICKKIEENDLTHIVKIVGPIFGKQKNEFWQNADLFVFPTYHNEGLPYSVLESMASGTPLITTRVGGNIDVIKEGIEGLFVEPHDPHGIAEAVSGLLGNAELLATMSTECVKRVNNYYGIERMAEQFKLIYMKLCE